MTDDDVLNDRQHLKAGPGFMRQPFKIYENLRSAVSVYRGQASKGVYQVIKPIIKSGEGEAFQFLYKM